MKGFFALLRVSVPVWIVGLIFIPSRLVIPSL